MAFEVLHRKRETIRIGVIRDDEIGVLLTPERKDEIHRAGLFRVWKTHGWEGAVWLGLGCDAVHVREACRLERAHRGRIAHAVKCRVGDDEVALHTGVQDELLNRRVVLRLKRRGDERGEALLKRFLVGDTRHLRERADRFDRGRDAFILRRDNLRGVAPIDLVAVVFGRVVTGRDHDGTGRVRLFAHEADDGRGHHMIKDAHVHACTRGHSDDFLGELAAHATAIEANDKAARIRIRHKALQVRDEALGGLANDREVHAVGAAADHAAKACGAEREASVESIGEVCPAACIQERLHLGACCGVRILREPSLNA